MSSAAAIRKRQPNGETAGRGRGRGNYARGWQGSSRPHVGIMRGSRVMEGITRQRESMKDGRVFSFVC